DIGCRWYQANAVAPLFPFGFGLDYTTFALSDAKIAPLPAGGYAVQIDVTNTGTRSGADVVQAYVSDPSGLGEPPAQLRGFTRLVLAPGATSRATVVLPVSIFASDAGGSPTVVAGNYVVGVGESSADLPIQLPLKVPAQAA